MVLVCLEEGCEGGVPLSHLDLFQYACHIRLVLRVIDDRLLIGEVDLEFDHCRLLCMHVEFKQAPACFRGCNESGIQIVFHFIVIPAEFDSGPISSFVDIFVDVYLIDLREKTDSTLM